MICEVSEGTDKSIQEVMAYLLALPSQACDEHGVLGCCNYQFVPVYMTATDGNVLAATGRTCPRQRGQ